MFKAILKIIFFIAVFTSIDTHLLSSYQIFLHHLLFLLLMPLLIYKHRVIPIYFLLFTILSLIPDIYFTATGYNKISYVIKFFAGSCATLLFFYYYIREFDFDVKEMFAFYMKCAVFTSVHFFFQLFFFKIGFEPGYDVTLLTGRQNVGMDPDYEFLPASFLNEPSALAMVLSPALFVALYNLIRFQKLFIGLFSSATIVAAVMFSYSSTAYVAIFACLLLLLSNYANVKTILIATIFGILAFTTLYEAVPRFRVRFDDACDVFIHNQIQDPKQLKNGSVMILFNNLQVALQNMNDHPLLGTGFGSHPAAFDRYNQFHEDEVWWAELNKEDACSMFIRLMSETGIVGLLLLFIFLIRFSVNKNLPNNIQNRLISKGLLVLFIVTLLRQGNYIMYGFPFFFLLYYYIWKVNRLQNPSGDIRTIN